MGSNRLLQYISSLSDEDRKQHERLIDDALRRDRLLAEAFCEAKRHAESYEANSKRLMETAEEFHASLLRLNGKLAGVVEASGNAFRLTPYGAKGNRGSTVRH